MSHQLHLGEVHTAAVETEDEEMECVALLPDETVETAIAQASTLTETDVGAATVAVASMNLIEAGGGSGEGGSPLTERKFWTTSLGRFRFTLQELPSELQLIYELMKVSLSTKSSLCRTSNGTSRPTSSVSR